MKNASEELKVLYQRETTVYTTQDYLHSSQCGKFDIDSHEGDVQQPPSVVSRGDDTSSHASDITVDISPQRESKKRKLCQGSQSYLDLRRDDSDDILRRRLLWREKLCEWAYQVVDHFGLSRELVSISMNTLDRHCGILMQRQWIQKRKSVLSFDREEYALTAMTCLSLAIKLFEYKHILVPGSQSTMETILKLCQGTFSMQQVEAKEYDILNSLHWKVHPPTSQLFLHYFVMESRLGESPSCNEVRDLALYFIEISVLDYSFISYKASEIAIAALLNAIDTIITSSTYQFECSIHAHLREYRTDRTGECQNRLAEVYSYSTTDDTCHEAPARIQSPVSVTATVHT